jgi:hypothetical protein
MDIFESSYNIKDGFIQVNPSFSLELIEELNSFITNKSITVWKYKYSPKEGLDAYYCNGWTNKPEDLNLLCLTKSQVEVKVLRLYATQTGEINIEGIDQQSFRWFIKLTKNSDDIYTIKLTNNNE